jgi:hypothetical protein
MTSPCCLKIHATSLSLAGALGAACGPTAPGTTNVETDPTADTTAETGTGDPSTTDPTDPTTTTAPTDPTDPPPQCVEDSDCGGYCEYCYDGQCSYGGPGCCGGYGIEPAPGPRGWRCSPPPYYDCYDDAECAEDQACIDHECVVTVVPVPQCPSDPIDPSAWNLAGPPSALVLADLDGDGDLDVATTLVDGPKLQLSFNDGAGVFTPAEPTDLDGTPMGLAAGDLEGTADGADLVIATAAPDGVFVVLSGSGFTLGTFTSTDTPPRAVFAGTFNDDAFADVVAIDGVLASPLVLLGDGAGALAPPLSSPTIAALTDASLSDLDGDGRDDIVALVDGAAVGVVFSAADGTLSGGLPLAADPPLSHAHAGLFDSSMLPALFATRDHGASGGIFVWTGFEVGGWNNPLEFTTAARLLGGATADLNGDGFTDVISATGDSAIAVLLADGLGAFACEQTYPGPDGDTQAPLVAAGDVNGDGRVDIVAAAAGTGAIVALRH